MITLPLLKEMQTPAFLFDESELRANFNDFNVALQKAWSSNSCVAYSVKTNHIPWVLKVAREEGCKAEVVSDDEYELALSCGFKPEQLVFNGPVKGRSCFEYAITHKSYVNIDSAREIRWAIELAQTDINVNLGIRANILLEKYCPGECLSDEHHGRFGFSYESGELTRVIKHLQENNVEINGLHMHVTTRTRSLKVYDTLSKYAARIIQELDLDLDYVDIGGGFFGGGPQNAGAYDDYALIIAKNLRKACDPSTTDIITEPGGAVVCTPGYYIGRVIDTKKIMDEHYVVTELSRINIDHEMKKDAYNLSFFTTSNEMSHNQIICGYTCMDSDRLCTLEYAPSFEEGDFIVVNFAGAYSCTFTPEMFIWYPPAIYKILDGKLECLRPLHPNPVFFQSTMIGSQTF